MSIYLTELNCILCLKLNLRKKMRLGRKEEENVGTSLKPSELESDFLTLLICDETIQAFCLLSLLRVN